VLQISCVFISALRLSIFLDKIKLPTLLYARLVSNAYGFILPGQLAVEGYRAFLIGKDNNEYSKPGAAVIVDKIIGLIAVLVLGIVGLLITESIDRNLVVIFCIVGTTFVLFLFSLNIFFVRNNLYKLLSFLSRKIVKMSKIFTFFIQFLSQWQTYIDNKCLLIKSFLYGIVFQFLCVLIGTLFTFGVGENFHIIDWLWIHAIIAIALVLPITLGGIGIRDAGIIGMLGIIGIAQEKALAISFGFLSLHLFQAFIGIGLEVIMTLRKVKTIRNTFKE